MSRRSISVGHLVLPINGMENHLKNVPLIVIDQDDPYYKTNSYLRNQHALTFADTKFFQDLGLASKLEYPYVVGPSKLEHLIYGISYGD